jgi:hypothetical protein
MMSEMSRRETKDKSIIIIIFDDSYGVTLCFFPLLPSGLAPKKRMSPQHHNQQPPINTNVVDGWEINPLLLHHARRKITTKA